MATQTQREARELIAAAEQQGFRTRPTKNGTRILGKDGHTTAIVHYTPSDYRGRKNTIASLRRMGVAV